MHLNESFLAIKKGDPKWDPFKETEMLIIWGDHLSLLFVFGSN